MAMGKSGGSTVENEIGVNTSKGRRNTTEVSGQYEGRANGHDVNLVIIENGI